MILGFKAIMGIASAVLGAALVACAGQTPATSVPATSAPEAMPAKINSDIVDFSLEALTVPLGTTIIWVNRDPLPHTTTQGTGPNKPDSAEWDSGVLMHSQSFSLTFDKPGTFAYFCTIHPNMQATICRGSHELRTTSPIYCSEGWRRSLERWTFHAPSPASYPGQPGLSTLGLWQGGFDRPAARPCR